MAYIDRGVALSPEAVEDIAWAIQQSGFSPGPGGSCIVPFQPQPNGGLDGYFKVVGARLLALAVVGLWPSQQIVAHRDPPIVGRRFHIPVQACWQCWSFHDGVWQHLEVGRGYEMDPTGLHGAVNWGSEIRYHLMIDVEKT